MIKVPFDTLSHGQGERAHHLNRIELKQTLDRAYKTMDWFKFLADKAIKVTVLDTEYSPNKVMTTVWIGFELDGKNETFYRLKYERHEK